MKPSRGVVSVAAAMLVSLCWLEAQGSAPVPDPVMKKAAMPAHASGTFDVKITPQAQDENAGGAALGRMTLDKQFHGDLEGAGKGQMLAAGTAVKDSAGYVALEIVSGALRGRSGTFVLQHTGTMNRGTPQLAISVVPDSGTGQLVGLAGKMAITVASGKHSYEFEYTLPDPAP